MLLYNVGEPREKREQEGIPEPEMPPGGIVAGDGKLNQCDCDKPINVLLYNVEPIEKGEENEFPEPDVLPAGETTGSDGKLN